MKIRLFLIAIVSLPIFSQTGPGGVGTIDGTSNLILWLDANKVVGVDGATITTWNDQSGNGNNFTAGNGAVFNTSVVNGYPAFNFNGTTHYFQRAYSTALNPSNFTVITSNNVTSSSGFKAVISNRDDLSGPSTAGFILYSRPTNNRWQFWTGGSTGWNTGASNISTSGSWSGQLIRFRNSNNRKQLFIDGRRRFNGTHNMILNTARPFRIGAGRNENTTPAYYFKGKVGEVIMFKNFINNAQRIIIDNYLAAKYNYTLSQRDYYTQDNIGNGNFDHNVAGIGMQGGESQTDSQGTGIIRINTPSALTSGDYLFWGEETKNATYNFSTTSDYLERLNSKWRVSKINDLGTVNVSVKETDLNLTGKQLCANLKLIVSSSSTFATKTSYAMTLSGGVFTATAVNFSDGDYFTLEYQDLIVLDGTQFYNGSGVGNRPDTTDSCYKFLVKSTADGTLTLSQDAKVREVEVENGGKLVVDSGKNIEVTNAVKLNGEIRLIGNSQLIQTHSGSSQVTGSGKIYLDKTTKLTNVYQTGFWASPVTTSGNTFTIASAIKDGTTPTSATSIPQNINYVDALNGATGSPLTLSRRWLASLIDRSDFLEHQDENHVYNPVEGINIKLGKPSGQNYTFVGKPNDGDYTTSITSGNYSLIGNPYPSTLDADKFLSDNSAIFSTLYFWDGINDNSNTHYRSAYAGGYATYVPGMGTPFGAGATPNKYISVGQAFFVFGGATGSIVFNNAQRVFNTTSQFFGRTTPFPILRIGLDIELENNEVYHRQLGVGFRGMSNNLDQFDAYMFDFQPSDFSLQVNDDSSDFVIAGIEDYSEDIEIPLRVKVDQQRKVTFMIDAIENFTPNNIYLKDALVNQFYDLSSPVDLILPTGDYTNRFSIVFNNGVLSANDVKEKNNEVVIIDRDENINVKSTYINISNIRLYTILGQLIMYKEVNNKSIDLPIQNASGKILIINIELDSGKIITRKLIKK